MIGISADQREMIPILIHGVDFQQTTENWQIYYRISGKWWSTAAFALKSELTLEFIGDRDIRLRLVQYHAYCDIHEIKGIHVKRRRIIHASYSDADAAAIRLPTSVAQLFPTVEVTWNGTKETVIMHSEI